MVTQRREVCLICEVKPRYNGSRFCHDCEGKLKANGGTQKAVKPDYYLTYHGITVGFFRNERGKLTPRLLHRDIFKVLPSGDVKCKVPTDKVINLDEYCPGYTREQVKRFKAVVAELMPKFARN